MTTTAIPSGHKKQTESGKARDREQIPAIHLSGLADIGSCRADRFLLLPLFLPLYSLWANKSDSPKGTHKPPPDILLPATE